MAGRHKGTPKTGGRQKGTPNKISADLKADILEAANLAGGEGGTIAYLRAQAGANPTAFMSLLGRVLPLQGPGPQGEHKFIVGWQKPE